MKGFVLKLLNIILGAQEAHYKQKTAKGISSGLLSAGSGSKKMHLTSFASLSISSKLNSDKQKLNSRVEEIVKKNIQTPEKLLEFVKKNNTQVYKVPHANKILNLIGEEEGFLTPIKGYKALVLNVALGRGFSFSTPAMFVLRDLPVNIYYMSHQFHKWYGYKMKLPGFEELAQKNFKKVWEFQDSNKAATLSYDEILCLKEAIARDVEAIDFVLKLTKESKGAQNAYKVMVEQGGANV